MNYKSKKKIFVWLIALMMVISTMANANVTSVKAAEETRFNFNFNGNDINGTVEYKVNSEENWHSATDIDVDAGGSRWISNLNVGDTITLRVAANEGYIVDENLSIGKRGQGSRLSAEDFSAIIGPEGYVYTISEAGEYEIEHIFGTAGGQPPEGNPPGAPGDENTLAIYIGDIKVYDYQANPQITVPEGADYEIVEGEHGQIILRPVLDEKLGELFLQAVQVTGNGTLEIHAGRMNQIDANTHTEQDTNITIEPYFNEIDETDPRNGYSIFTTDNAEVEFLWGNSRAYVNILGGIIADRLVVSDIAGFTVGVLNDEEKVYERSMGISAVHKKGSYISFEQAFVSIYGWNGFRNYEKIEAADEAEVNVDAFLIFDNVDRLHVQTGGAFHLNNADEAIATIAMPEKITSGYYVEIGQILEIDRDGRIQDCVKTVDCQVGDFSDSEGRYRYFNDGGRTVSLESATAALWSLGYTFTDDGRDDVVTNGYFEVKAGSGLVDVSYTDGGSYWFEAGTEIEFKLVPNNGCQYVPGTFAFNGETSEDVVIPSDIPGVYTFVMPNNPIHVACVFEEAENKVSIDENAGVTSANVTLPENINGTAELVVADTELTDGQLADFEDAAGDKNIGSTIDLSLNEVIDKIGSDDSWNTPITDLEKPVTVTLELSEEDDGNSDYAIIREHNGETTVIEAEYDDQTGTISFPTDGFSTYAIAYDKKEHTHTFATDWSMDAINHWKASTCGHDDVVDKLGAHEYDDMSDRTCNTCGHERMIKGICQMPYGMLVPGENGFLIGLETYDNPNQAYKYEMLILDCTLLAEGKDAWIYTTGQKAVPEKCFWTVWQPKYGYYWTLFRVYDADGNLIDQECYGFQNI